VGDEDRRYFDPELNPPILDEVAAMVEWKEAGRDVEGWRREHAVGQWRRHARAFEEPAFDAQRPAYERAVAFGLGHLQRVATFEALVDHYFDDRHSRRGGKHRGMVPVDPIAGTVERWVADAIAQAGDDELNRPFVEELAFGRRARQLIDQAAAPGD
jgi:hypothetical protein